MQPLLVPAPLPRPPLHRRLRPYWRLPVILALAVLLELLSGEGLGVAVGVLLMGTETEGTTGNVAVGGVTEVCEAFRYECVATGTITAIKYHTGSVASSNEKTVASIFNDVAGTTPGTLATGTAEVEATGKPTTNAVNEITGFSVAVTKGTFYWIAIQSVGAGTLKVKVGATTISKSNSVPTKVKKPSETTVWSAEEKRAPWFIAGTGTEGSAKVQTLAASLTFAGTLGRTTAHQLSAGLTFTGALPRAIVHGLVAALTFVGQVAPQIAGKFVRPLTASLTFTGVLPRAVVKQLSAGLTFAGALGRNTVHALSASLTFAGTLGRRIVKQLTAALTFAGLLTPEKITTANVYYGPAGEKAEEEAKRAERESKGEVLASRFLDVYPAAAAGSPLVILVHGGGWLGGDKKERNTQAKLLNEQGFAVFNIDHRLDEGGTVDAFPKEIADVEEAVLYARANAASYNASTKRVYLIGGSAGGHLVPMAAIGLNGATPGTVRGVVTLSGVFDLLKVLEDEHNGVEKIPGIWGPDTRKALKNAAKEWPLKASVEAESKLYSSSRQLTKSNKTTQFLIFNSAEEETTSKDQPTLMKEAIEAVGGAVTYTEVPGKTHSFSYWGTVERQIYVFVKTPLLEPSLTFTGALPRAIVRGLAAGLTFTGHLVPQMAGKFVRTLEASLTFTGALQRATMRPLTASLTFTGVLPRAVVKQLSAGLTFAGALGRNTVHALSASLTFAGTLGRRIVHGFRAALSFVGHLVPIGGGGGPSERGTVSVGVAPTASVTITDGPTG